MFTLRRPAKSAIDSFVASAIESDFSYSNVGLSRQGSPSGFNVDHNRIRLGDGPATFDLAKNAIREWKMFDLAWVELCWPEAPIEVERNVAVLIRHFGFYSLNAARIVYVIDEADRFGFAYGTLDDHGESGEERFAVEIDKETGAVWYDLYAFSRPNAFLGKLGYPLTRLLQKRFAKDSMAAMKHAVRRGNIS